MHNNDVLRSLRFLLKAGKGQLAALAKRADYVLSKEQLAGFLTAEGDDGFVAMSDEALLHVLDGLVMARRGWDKAPPPPGPAPKLSNNLVLKKLRTAFQLKDSDIIAVVKSSGFDASKAEVSALFRAEGQRNYRPCGDQFLRYFFKGLGASVAASRPEPAASSAALSMKAPR